MEPERKKNHVPVVFHFFIMVKDDFGVPLQECFDASWVCVVWCDVCEEEGSYCRRSVEEKSKVTNSIVEVTLPIFGNLSWRTIKISDMCSEADTDLRCLSPFVILWFIKTVIYFPWKEDMKGSLGPKSQIALKSLYGSWTYCTVLFSRSPLPCHSISGTYMPSFNHRWEVYDNVNVSYCQLYLLLDTTRYELRVVCARNSSGPKFQNLKIFLFWCVRPSPRFVIPLGYDYRYRTCSSLKNFRDLQVNHSSGTPSFFFRELTSFMTFSISRLTFHMRNQDKW